MLCAALGSSVPQRCGLTGARPQRQGGPWSIFWTMRRSQDTVCGDGKAQGDLTNVYGFLTQWLNKQTLCSSVWLQDNGYKLKNSLKHKKKPFLQWSWSNSGTGCPERLEIFRTWDWRYSEPAQQVLGNLLLLTCLWTGVWMTLISALHF